MSVIPSATAVRWHARAEPESLPALRREVAHQLLRWKLASGDVADIQLAASELVANALVPERRNGHKGIVEVTLAQAVVMALGCRHLRLRLQGEHRTDALGYW